MNLDDVKQNNLIDPNEESDDRRKKKEKNSSLQINQKQSINERLGTAAATTTASNQQNILNRLQDNMSVDKTMTTTTSACSKFPSTEA